MCTPEIALILGGEQYDFHLGPVSEQLLRFEEPFKDAIVMNFFNVDSALLTVELE